MRHLQDFVLRISLVFRRCSVFARNTKDPLVLGSQDLAVLSSAGTAVKLRVPGRGVPLAPIPLASRRSIPAVGLLEVVRFFSIHTGKLRKGFFSANGLRAYLHQ